MSGDDKRCISRRDFARVGLGTAAMLAGLGLTDALEPEVVEALTLPVSFTQGRRVNYDRFFTNEARVNGYLGFCVNPSNYMATTGNYGDLHDDPAWDSAAYHHEDVPGQLGVVRWQLRKIMYNGLEGPNYSDGFFPATWFDGSAMDWDKRYACQHILLSDIYALDFAAATYGCTQAFKSWARAQVTGVGTGSGVVPGSMRAHVSSEADGGDSLSWPDAPDAFSCYVLDCGYDAAHGRDYQRILFAEPNGRANLSKEASRKEWL